MTTEKKSYTILNKTEKKPVVMTQAEKWCILDRGRLPRYMAPLYMQGYGPLPSLLKTFTKMSTDT